MTEIKRDPVELTVQTKDANDHYIEVLGNLLKDLNEVAWCGDLLKVFGPDIYRVRALAEMLKADLEECVDEQIEVLDLADGTHRELIETKVLDEWEVKYPKKYTYFVGGEKD
jgi:hypothetical protein